MLQSMGSQRVGHNSATEQQQSAFFIGLEQKHLTFQGIIRHLILPNNIENSKQVLKEIAENFDKKIYVSLMGQYIPQDKSTEYEELNRKITEEEYDEVIDYFFEVGLEKGFMQELESASEEYIPKF